MKRRDLLRKGLFAATAIPFADMLYTEKLQTFFPATPGNVPDFSGNLRINPIIESEEEVYRYEPADNGAGPMWCRGSTCIVRAGDRVFASGLETVPDWVPLNNCRWFLYEKTSDGWKLRVRDKEGRTREPSPLVIFHDGNLFLSANPSLAELNVRSGPARPEILLFKSGNVQKPYERILPVWFGEPKFSEHSYRSFAADGQRGELILFQNLGYTHAEWAFRDSTGKWAAQGKLEWPWGADYEKPQPIRTCYPAVALKDRKVYFFGVSDIIEPKSAWREYKKEITGRDWDYDFRRLFMTWSDDITTGKFHPWIEIASREETCGWISPNDLWIAPDDKVHLLWNERAIDERLREKFFPEAKQSNALNYAIFNQGKVILRKTLVLAREGRSDDVPVTGRGHVCPDNKVYVVDCVGRKDKQGKTMYENRIMGISSRGVPGKPVILPLQRAFTNFFTSTIRGGSAPSDRIDLLGTLADERQAIYYAGIRLG